jgi:hypothetical protein
VPAAARQAADARGQQRHQDVDLLPLVVGEVGNVPVPQHLGVAGGRGQLFLRLIFVDAVGVAATHRPQLQHLTGGCL